MNFWSQYKKEMGRLAEELPGSAALMTLVFGMALSILGILFPLLNWLSDAK